MREREVEKKGRGAGSREYVSTRCLYCGLPYRVFMDNVGSSRKVGSCICCANPLYLPDELYMHIQHERHQAERNPFPRRRRRKREVKRKLYRVLVAALLLAFFGSVLLLLLIGARGPVSLWRAAAALVIAEKKEKDPPGKINDHPSYQYLGAVVVRPQDDGGKSASRTFSDANTKKPNRKTVASSSSRSVRKSNARDPSGSSSSNAHREGYVPELTINPDGHDIREIAKFFNFRLALVETVKDVILGEITLRNDGFDFTALKNRSFFADRGRDASGLPDYHRILDETSNRLGKPRDRLDLIFLVPKPAEAQWTRDEMMLIKRHNFQPEDVAEVVARYRRVGRGFDVEFRRIVPKGGAPPINL